MTPFLLHPLEQTTMDSNVWAQRKAASSFLSYAKNRLPSDICNRRAEHEDFIWQPWDSEAHTSNTIHFSEDTNQTSDVYDWNKQAYLCRLNKESSRSQISWIAACFVPAVSSSLGVILTEETETDLYSETNCTEPSSFPYRSFSVYKWF